MAIHSGCYFVTASYLFYGPASISFLGFMGPFVGQCMMDFGFGFTAPSYNTIVSWRVQQQDQAKAAATMAVMGNLGWIFGAYFYSFYLHDATWEGMDATRPFQASACFMGLVALGATGTALREGCVDKPDGPRAYEELRRQRSKRP